MKLKGARTSRRAFPSSTCIIAGAGLGRGELEALALYKRLDAGRLLLDDRRARGVARVNSVEVIGSLGALLLAQTRGLLPAVRPSLEAIRAAGIHLSDSLVVETLRIAGEEPRRWRTFADTLSRERIMTPLDRSIIKIGTLALLVCAVGVIGAENPRARKGAGPAPLHVTLGRAPACVPSKMVYTPPAPVAPMPAYRGSGRGTTMPNAIVPIPSPCAKPPSEEDAAAALKRLRADLARINVLREAASSATQR